MAYGLIREGKYISSQAFPSISEAMLISTWGGKESQTY